MRNMPVLDRFSGHTTLTPELHDALTSSRINPLGREKLMPELSAPMPQPRVNPPRQAAESQTRHHFFQQNQASPQGEAEDEDTTPTP